MAIYSGNIYPPVVPVPPTPNLQQVLTAGEYGIGHGINLNDNLGLITLLLDPQLVNLQDDSLYPDTESKLSAYFLQFLTPSPGFSSYSDASGLHLIDLNAGSSALLESNDLVLNNGAASIATLTAKELNFSLSALPFADYEIIIDAEHIALRKKSTGDVKAAIYNATSGAGALKLGSTNTVYTQITPATRTGINPAGAINQTLRAAEGEIPACEIKRPLFFVGGVCGYTNSKITTSSSGFIEITSVTGTTFGIYKFSFIAGQVTIISQTSTGAGNTLDNSSFFLTTFF